MFDTPITVIGNALHAPELKRVLDEEVPVATFKVATTSRRWDRASDSWVDGGSLRVRVNCWRRLAEGVAASVTVGDPIVVVGRLYTRDWIGEDKVHRVSYELEARTVGHDLSRGHGTFTRHRATQSTSAVEDAEADARIGGQPATPYEFGDFDLTGHGDAEEAAFEDEAPFDLSAPDLPTADVDGEEDTDTEDPVPARKRRRREPVGV
jgi:single-strand DNA-binding protein